MSTLPYIVEVQIAFALLWLVYRAAMHRGGRLALNRAWLLAIPALALLIPALTLRVWPAPQMVAMPVFDIGPIEATVAVEPAGFDIRRVYLAGVVVLLIVSVAQLLRLGHIIRTAQERLRIDGCACLQTERIGRAATFLNYILVNPASLDEGELRQVVAHERAHVALGHSYDLFFSRIVCIALWWNPFVWLWQRSLREVHEFQADARVLSGGFDAGNYATLILHSLTGIRPGFASGFSYQLLKNRLVMIKNSRRGSATRILFVLPVVAGLMAAFSCAAKKPQSQPAAEPTRVIAYAPQPPAGPETTPVARPAERPMRELAGRVESVIEIDIHGTDTVVHINGELIPMEHLDLKTLHSDTSITRTRLTIHRDRSTMNVHGIGSEGQPLLFIDGVEAPHSILKAIDPDKIQRIDVLKDAASIARYGERGRNGVILVTLKNEESAAQSDNADEPYLKVEQMPTFQGGDLNAFRTWMMSQLRYPAEAANNQESGRVVASFVVEKDGTVSSIRVVNSTASTALTDEVVRVINSSAKWMPGEQRGRKVRVKYTIPVDFKIPE